MTNITNEVLETERWRACLDEARQTLDAWTTHQKLGVVHRLSFKCNQIYGFYAARLYDQGWGKSEGSLAQ